MSAIKELTERYERHIAHLSARVVELDQEIERRIKAHGIAFDQAMENGAELSRARSALRPFAEMANWLDDTNQRRDAIYCGGVPGLKCEVTQADYHKARAASVDTHAERGDVKLAPSLMGSAVPKADAQKGPNLG